MTVGIDYERVVDGLERCYKYETATSSGLICEECPYNKESGLRTCSALLLKEALELLKEQEPVEPIEQTETITRYKCGFCGNRLYLKEHKFCHWCGRSVKWNE